MKLSPFCIHSLPTTPAPSFLPSSLPTTTHSHLPLYFQDNLFCLMSFEPSVNNRAFSADRANVFKAVSAVNCVWCN